MTPQTVSLEVPFSMLAAEEKVRIPVTSSVVNEFAGARLDVFQRDPRRRQFEGRRADDVGGILMDLLLRAVGEVKILKSERIAPKDEAKKPDGCIVEYCAAGGRGIDVKIDAAEILSLARLLRRIRVAHLVATHDVVAVMSRDGFDILERVVDGLIRHGAAKDDVSVLDEAEKPFMLLLADGSLRKLFSSDLLGIKAIRPQPAESAVIAFSL